MGSAQWRSMAASVRTDGGSDAGGCPPNRRHGVLEPPDRSALRDQGSPVLAEYSPTGVLWRSVTFKFVYFKSLCVFCFLFYFVVSLSLYVVSASRVCHFLSWWLCSPVPHVLHLWPITPAFPVPLYNPLCSPLVLSVRTRFHTVSLMVCLVPAVSSASTPGSIRVPRAPCPALTLRLSLFSVMFCFCLVKDSVLH